MVKIFIYTLLAIVAAVVLSLYFDLLSDPGYLLIAWRNYTFETSLFALIVFFISLVIVIRLGWLFLSALNPMQFFQIGGLFGTGRVSRSHSKTTEGLLRFVHSDWTNACQFLERSFNDRECTVVNFLAASYAACELGQHDRWEDYLAMAAKKFPAALTTINTVRAELLMKAGHLEQSLAVLEQVKRSSVKDRQLLILLKEVYTQLEDWVNLKAILPTLKKANVLGAEDLQQLEVLIYRQELRQQVEMLSSQEPVDEAGLKTLLKSWKKAPASFHVNPDLVEYFVTLLNDAGAHQEASQIIESALGKTWNERLLSRYGELDFRDHAFQLAHAEDWLQQRPNDAGLLLVLGRLAMRNEQWEKAREYLEASIDTNPTAVACGELSRLLNALGETEESLRYWEKCARLGGVQLAELVMPGEEEAEIADPEE